jgi:cob(I)alamin adenosyltransferase
VSIYTKTGDTGDTSLFDGTRVSKTHPRVIAYGDVDEVQACLGMVRAAGLPQESNKLCDVFGHIMNYGDGVYGGMFVAGMYAAAYFEDKDIHKVIEAGLACIPDESLYEACIRDVVKQHKQLLIHL